MNHTCAANKETTSAYQAPLLSVDAIRSSTGFGRTLSYRIIDRLPHLTIGRKKKLVNRACFEAYLHLIARYDADLWDDVENPDGLWSQVVSDFKASR